MSSAKLSKSQVDGYQTVEEFVGHLGDEFLALKTQLEIISAQTSGKMRRTHIFEISNWLKRLLKKRYRVDTRYQKRYPKKFVMRIETTGFFKSHANMVRNAIFDKIHEDLAREFAGYGILISVPTTAPNGKRYVFISDL